MSVYLVERCEGTYKTCLVYQKWNGWYGPWKIWREWII